MSVTLGIDLFEINGIPMDIELMHNAFPNGWYQISNGLTLQVLVRKAWPVYARHYGGYHFFNANPPGNWISQSMTDYAEACAWLFVDSMKGNSGGCPPMIDFEKDSLLTCDNLNHLFPNMSDFQQTQKANRLYFQMLKIILDIVEQETKQIPVLYTGNSFWVDVVNGQNESWAARYPLMIAIYPFDQGNTADYLPGIQTIMDGTNTLSSIPIPPPWTAATYIQFTGKYPAAQVPGYPKERNWAKGVDLSLQVPKETHRSKESVRASRTRVMNNLFSSDQLLNVQADSNKRSQLLGNLPADSIIAVDQTVGNYSHFAPNSLFPVGGWVITKPLVRITS